MLCFLRILKAQLKSQHTSPWLATQTPMPLRGTKKPTLSGGAKMEMMGKLYEWDPELLKITASALPTNPPP